MPNTTKIGSIVKTTTTTATFLPTSITGCKLWLDGADPTTIIFSSGSNINQWNDKSGNGVNVTQPTTASQPSYTAASNSVLFSYTTSMLMGNTSYYNTLCGSPFTMFFVHKKLQGHAWLLSPGNYIVTFTGTLRFTTAAVTDLDYTTPNFTTVDAEPLRIFTVQWTGTERNVRMNGQLTAYNMNNNGSTSWTNAPVVDSNWAMGGAGSSSAGNTQNMYEVLFYNSALSTTNRQTVESYLAQKWNLTSNLPAGHPGLTTTLYGTSIVPVPITTTVTLSPTSIAGCALWLDAADTTTLTFSSGSNVSKWKDKSASVNDFNLTSGTVSYMNDGAFSTLRFPSGAIMTSANTITWTTSSAFFIVSKVTDTTYFSYLLGFSSISSGDYGIKFLYGILTGTPGSAQYAGEFGSSNFYVNGNFNPNYGSNYYTNVYAVIDITAPTSGGTSAITLSSSFYSRYFVGSIAEFIFYPAGITSTQRQQVEGYLAQKWGLTASLPAGHPGLTTTLYGTVALPRQKLVSIPRTITASFLPTSIAGCQLWLDGADTSSMTLSSGTVSQWNDKSGKGFNATTPAGTNSPPYNATTRELQFVDTNSNVLRIAQGFGDSLVGTTYSIFFISRRTVASGYHFILASTANGASRIMLMIGFNGNTMSTNTYGPEFNTAISTYTSPDPVRLYCFELQSSSLVTHILNGTQIGSDTQNYTLTSFANPELGRRYTGPFHTFNLSEMIAFSPALTTTQRQNVEGYLAQKWGLTASLPAGHPGLTTTLYGTVTLPKQKIRTILPIPSATITFSYTGADQSFIVPGGITSVTVYMWAGGGKGTTSINGSFYGGAAAYVQGVLTVTPGETLTIYVGQGGITGPTFSYKNGGYNNVLTYAASAAGTGGGRSGIARGSTNIVAVGAGGGSGGSGNGGAGGIASGSSGGGSNPGGGGTQSAGGSAGSSSYNSGGVGQLFGGGTGPSGDGDFGGSGGDGFYGGGGGSAYGSGQLGGGGGGGSSLTSNLTSLVTFVSSNGYSAPNTASQYYTSNIAAGGFGSSGTAGNGLVVIKY